MESAKAKVQDHLGLFQNRDTVTGTNKRAQRSSYDESTSGVPFKTLAYPQGSHWMVLLLPSFLVLALLAAVVAMKFPGKADVLLSIALSSPRADHSMCFIDISIVCKSPECKYMGNKATDSRNCISKLFQYHGGRCATGATTTCFDFTIDGSPADYGKVFIIVEEVLGKVGFLFADWVEVGGFFKLDDPEGFDSMKGIYTISVYSTAVLSETTLLQRMILNTDCAGFHPFPDPSEWQLPLQLVGTANDPRPDLGKASFDLLFDVHLASIGVSQVTAFTALTTGSHSAAIQIFDLGAWEFKTTNATVKWKLSGMSHADLRALNVVSVSAAATSESGQECLAHKQVIY
jgi:hypothetical protein